MSNGSFAHSDRPASVFQSKQANRDPLQAIGMPPNAGDFVVPHAVEFLGIMRTIARTYLPSDEALIDSRENARFMRNDVGILECLEQRQRSTALLEWHLEAEDENDATAKQLADDLTVILKQTPDFLKYRECCLEALWFGKYGISQRFRWKEIRGKQRLCVDKWMPVNGDKIVYRYDDGSGEFCDDQVGIRVGSGFTGRLNTGIGTEDRWKQIEATDWGMCYFLTPTERPLLAIHKHRIEDGEYEAWEFAGRVHGIGIRSRIYWEWMQKQEALAYLMELLERSAGGIELWPYPAGNDAAKEKTKQAAEERIGNGRNVVLIPVWPDMDMSMFQVRVVELNMAGAEIIQKLLTEYFGHRIKRYILGQTLTSEAASTGLGSGVASIHLDTYLQIIRYDSINLAETLTREVVDFLKKANFPHLASIPIYFKINTESPDVEGKLKGWRDAWEMGLKIPAKDMTKLIGSRAADEGEEVLQNPQTMAPAGPGGAAGGMGAAGAFGGPTGLIGPDGQPVDPRQSMINDLRTQLVPEVAEYLLRKGIVERTVYKRNGTKIRYRQAGPSLEGKFDPKSSTDQDHKAGWKTIGGGARVFIDSSGTITAGCPGLETEEVDEIGEGEDPENRQAREHRKDVADAKGLKGGDLSHAETKGLEAEPHPETGKTVASPPTEAPAAVPAAAPSDVPFDVPAVSAILNPRTRVGQAILAAAQDYGVSPDDLADAVEYVAEQRSEAGGNERQRALEAARKLTGLAPSDVKRLKNAGFDFTSQKGVPPRLANRLRAFDTFAQKIARQYPILGLGNPDDPGADFSAALWDMLDKDRISAVSLDDPDVLREAAALVQANQGGDWGEAIGATYEEDMPFALREGELLRYREWLVGSR